MKIIAAQLDLARQKENLKFIHSFIDFIARYGYNTLVLYLEGKIKTKSFPYPAARYSYTSEEMNEVVRYAGRKKIEIIPVVSTLGHAELILQFPELRHLSELAGGAEGRFWNKFHFQVCPLRNETYEFFRTYLAEIADIFPSQYFHAGMDESWDFGMCDQCRRRTERDGKSDYLFAEHITRIHKILAGLGKTMLIWDDMFEYYPAALELIPRDTIMCTWCYLPSITLPVAHFLHQRKEDVFRKYDRLGFRYLFCPSEVYPDNPAAFTRYARRHKPLGGLLTTWEKGNSFLSGHYPSIAFTGKLWSDGKRDERILLKEAIRELTGGDKEVVDHIEMYYSLRKRWYGMMPGYWRGEVTHREQEYAGMEQLLYEVLKKKADSGNTVVRNILYDLRNRLWQFRARRYLAEQSAGRAAGTNIPADSRPLLRDLERLRKDFLTEWRRQRSGIPSDNFVRSHASLEETFEKNISLVRRTDFFLTMRMFMPDPTGAPRMKIILKDAKGGESLLAEGQFKPPLEDITYYDYVFPCKSAPVWVRTEITGYGGQGLCFIKGERGGRVWNPASVNGVAGRVSGPEQLLCDDMRWTYLGDNFIREGFVVNEARNIVHSIEVRMEER